MPDEQQKLELMRQQQQAILDKHTKWTPATLPPDYAARMREFSPEQERWMRSLQLTTWENKRFGQVMDYTEARRLFWRVITRMVNGRHVDIFVVDQHNVKVIPDLVRYMIMDPDSTLPLHKGILLFGPIGTGKTLLMNALKTFADAASISYRQFSMTRAIDVANRMRTNIEAMYAFEKGDFCFDDIGQEPTHITHFGDKIPVMEMLLAARYDSFTVGKNITHMTSNLHPNEIEARYGSRVFDRIKEMFTPVYLTGQSRRK